MWARRRIKEKIQTPLKEIAHEKERWMDLNLQMGLTSMIS